MPIYFEPTEDAEVQSFLQIGLQSSWGGLLLADSGAWFYFDHDGNGLISYNEEDIEDLRGFDWLKVS